MPSQRDYPCPYCRNRALDTTATAPYVRGFLIVFQYGSKTFIGCRSCVRLKVLKEAGLSCLIGWFSPKALIANPFLILYNLFHTPLIKADPGKVRRKLAKAGIDLDAPEIDITRLGYALALAMISADGSVDKRELEVAIAIGGRLFEDFDQAEFLRIAQMKEVPSPVDIAGILRDELDVEGKKAVTAYLWAIANADGSVDRSEAELLQQVTDHLGLTADDIVVEAKEQESPVLEI